MCAGHGPTADHTCGARCADTRVKWTHDAPTMLSAIERTLLVIIA